MNRIIKFRAWDKSDKRWAEVHRLAAVLNGSEVYYIDKTTTWFDVAGFNRNLELMQFTGLTDKNGKEIYEGDVITSPSVGNLKQGSVEWGTCGFVVREQGVHGSKDGTWTEVLSSWAYPLDGQGALRGEIIGNIYENPELLENGDSKGGEAPNQSV